MRFHYVADLGQVPVGAGPIDIFIPLAQSDAQQEIRSYRIETSIPGRERVEEMYGNRFWHGHLARADGSTLRVEIHYELERRAFSNRRIERGGEAGYTHGERQRLALFLEANERVPIGGELIESITAGIAPGETSPARIARATYDYVIDNMEYKKVGTGWGNGDTYWACSAKYGNCTDFHSLFISLARARGIPARFEIGFPIAGDEPAGTIGGYHCWVQFYLPDAGWVPIDASEAAKHPARRELLFGTHPADRILFTTGRDLELGQGHSTGPLNYFIYPHVEVGGETYDQVETRCSYREIDAATSPSRSSSGGAGAGVAVAAGLAPPGDASPRPRIYGQVRMDLIYDDSRMFNSQFPFWVLSEDPASNPRDDDRLTMHPRLTRLGLKVDSHALAPGTSVAGKIEIDFQGGGRESRELIRMRHAYVTLDFGAVELLAGQNWDLISPLYPAADNDGLLWNAGNLGDRRPQVRLTWQRDHARGEVTVAVAGVMSGAVDEQDLDADGEKDGFAAGRPGVQGRLGLQQRLGSGDRELVFGVWAHDGREETATPVGGETRFTPWVAGLDLSLPFTRRLGLEAEAWTGADLSDLRGGIGQGVNPATGAEIRAQGGWAQMVIELPRHWTLYGGATLDAPRVDDVPDGGRSRNQALFAVARHRPWQTVQLGLEYLHWQTRYRGLDDGTSHRVDLHLTWFLP